ncbi:DUF3581 family protein [Thiomicrorhabdus arctica]|jgi:hypothetical protein|uniref:DUF3581 family protein n=1 Tax=Thiomicrorhabdus arctica TaxID=131540 RepID=UPI00035F787F|nr:DUF3581 family protein [Thiomicrorhabdus arctica]
MPLNTSYLEPFFQETDDFISITSVQASTFAKEVARDFNPLHNPDTKRFLVPGDLLFALVLSRTGLSQEMKFNYTGMMGNGVLLKFPKQPGNTFAIVDNQDKHYLEVSRNGDISTDMPLIEAFTRAYVAFSGHSFPHILVPLMKQHQVMINPDRPMVIYESMSFKLDHLDIQSPTLELIDSSLEVQGKRGTVHLQFQVFEKGEPVGNGYKTLVLSSLRQYDEAKVQALVEGYELIKADYKVS